MVVYSWDGGWSTSMCRHGLLPFQASKYPTAPHSLGGPVFMRISMPQLEMQLFFPGAEVPGLPLLDGEMTQKSLSIPH